MQPLGQLLLRTGAIAPPALDAALQEQDRDGGRLGTLLQARGAVEPGALRTALAAQFAMDTVAPGDVPVALLPAAEARLLRAVALWPTAAHQARDARIVAFDDPTPDRIEAVSRYLGRAVHPRIVDDLTLDALLERAYATQDAAAVAHAARFSRDVPASGELPTITVVAPVHGDPAAAVRRLWSALERVDYPLSRLQGVALVDAADAEARRTLALDRPPTWMRVTEVRVTGEAVRTALALHGVRNARGAISVVVDAATPPGHDVLRGAARTARRGRLDADGLVAAWAAPGNGTTSCDTRALARALGWEPPRAQVTSRRHETVWVCVPTYDEAATVQPLCRAVLRTLEDAGIDGHLLVIDDASPDGTGTLAEELARTEPRLHVLHRSRKDGIGPAYLAGFAHALANGADLIVEMDCDFSHDPAFLPRMIEEARRTDVVLGSRYVDGGEVTDWPLARRLISRGGSWYARRVLAVDIRDLTGGYKCFHRNVLEQLLRHDVRSAGYGFQIEMTYRALLAGHTVAEVPITFRDRVEGESKMSWHIAVEAAVNVLGLRRLRRA